MFDKIETLYDFRANTTDAFDNMFEIMSSSFRNIILINSNTPYLSNWIAKQLEKKNIKFEKLLYTELIECTSIGGYLRSTNNNNNDITLLIDFFGISSKNKYEIHNIANEININRDLFTKKYNSIILLTPPILTIAIKSTAIDIASCVDFYIDTTKWFCSPNALPIIKIRTYANPTQHIIHAYEANPEKYDDFISVKNEIKNLKTYSHENFTKILANIDKLSEGIYYYELLISFVKTITQIKACSNSQQQRIKDLKSITFSPDSSFYLIDIQLILAEFFYRSCYYEDAISRYRIALQILKETLRDPHADNIYAFLQCNIVTCVYMKDRIHAPAELLSDLKLRLQFSSINSSEIHSQFADVYLFLVKATCCHHTFAQHQELFSALSKLSFQNPPMCNLTDEFNQVLLWESFINSQFETPSQLNTSNMMLVYSKIQNMVCEFCKGNYHTSHMLYKKANHIAKGHGYMQISEFLENFQKNMHYLYMHK